MCNQFWPAVLVFVRATVFLVMLGPVRHALRGQGIVALSAALALWVSIPSGEYSFVMRPTVAPTVAAVGPEGVAVTMLRRAPQGSGASICAGASSDLAIASILLLQCFIAACAALPFAVAVEGAAMCGRLIDCVRGAQVGEALAPLSDTALSVNENIFRLAFVALACERGIATAAVCSIVGDHASQVGIAGFPLRHTPSLGYLDDHRIGVVLGESMWIAFPFGLSLLMFDLFVAVLFRTASGFGTSLSSWRMLAGVILWFPMSEALERLDVGRFISDHRRCIDSVDDTHRDRTYPSLGE